MHDPSSLLARLTTMMAATTARSPTALRLCLAFSALVEGDGGSISVAYAPPERVPLCATDDPAAWVEDVQDVLCEGPSLDAFRTGQAVTGLSLDEQERRWPMLAEMLASRGQVLTLHAFPIMPDLAVLGVVGVYQHGERDLAIEMPEAQFLANAVGVALLGDLETVHFDDERWAVRDRVDQATGMVVAQLKVGPPDALAVLRAHAFAHATTLATVSEWVLDRTLDFGDSDSADRETP